jgi:hypothetical protein
MCDAESSMNETASSSAMERSSGVDVDFGAWPRTSAHPGSPGSPLPSPVCILASSQAIARWRYQFAIISFATHPRKSDALELAAKPSHQHSLNDETRPTSDFSPRCLLVVSGPSSDFTLCVSGCLNICLLSRCSQCLCHYVDFYNVDPSSLASPPSSRPLSPSLSPYSHANAHCA